MQSLLSKLESLLPILIVVIAITALIVVIIWLSLKLFNIWRLYKQKVVYLELTPHTTTDRIPQATQQLFMALHGLGSRSSMERLLMTENSFSLEIVSTRKEGIRFIVRTPASKADSLEQLLNAYVSDIKVKRIDDYLIQRPTGRTRIIDFKQKQHYAYPLQSQDFLDQYDPISYVANAMTKLSGDEMISIQMIITPAHMREADTLRSKILNNEDLLPKLSGQNAFAPAVAGGINSVMFGITGAVGDVYNGSSKGQYFSAQKDLEYEKQVAKRLKPVRTLSYFEHKLVESINTKLAQPLFKTELRVLLLCTTKKELNQRKSSIKSAMSLFSVPKYQSLVTGRKKYGWQKRYQAIRFQHRLPSLIRSSNVFSATELAGLYHFPHTVSGKTENVIKSLSRTLPAPVSLKNGTKLDILLGENQHNGLITSIGLTEAERERHLYIIGGTGNGKTTMLLYSIVQDINNHKGVAVLDPHGDLAESILRHIPEERIKDVIYLNPDDLSHPIGINLLEITPGLEGDDLLREKDLITESTISVLRKLFSDDDSGGHRIEYIIRNTVQTALTTEKPTLFTIFRLLNDAKYRRGVVKNLKDEDLKNFWNNELGKAGEFQRVKMVSGITAKVGRFLFSASAKRILEQESSSIDFEDILNEGKILICNFSKGLLGEDASTLFGTTILAKLQVAALRRARIKQAERHSFYLYVDEFQNFATMSFVQMLSEARKYRLFLTMAEQSTSQQDQQRLVDIILANVGTLICFRSGSPADERYILPLFSPFIEQGEIANLPAYNFYARIAALDAQEPLSGITVLLTNTGSESVAQNVIQYSRSRYGKILEQINEQEIEINKTPPKRRKTKKKVTSSATKKVQERVAIE